MQASASQRQRPSRSGRGLAAPAAHGDVALGHAQQMTLKEDQRQRHQGDRHHHHGHELIRRRAQDIRQLEQIGGQHQHVGGIADDERQPEQLESEEEDQHAAVDQRRPDQRQADGQRDAPWRGAQDARLLFQLEVELAQRSRRKQIDVRHMGEARDDDQAGQRVQIPGHETDQALDRQRREADRADGNHIAERDHDRRQHDRHQQRRLDQALRRQVGAHDQESEQPAERHRDRGHAGGEHDRGHKGAREVGFGENKRVGFKAQSGRG